MIKYGLFIACILFSFTAKGQDVIYPYDESVMVIEGGNSLRNPWSGGFNSPQYSSMDLDNDGAEDLVVFERTSNRLYTFLVKTENSQKIYVHEPRYEKMFPPMISWVLLVDYNYDGKKDIFAHTNLGIMVYKNTSAPDTLTWQLMADPLNSFYTPSLSNIYVSITDIPSIVDIDNDGDMDIFNYDAFSGNSIQFHKNLSMETYGISDSLKFKDVDDCWGGVKEGTCTFTFGSNCPVFRTTGTMHTGASFIALKDMDGDGDKEIFSSKETCDKLNELVNKGSAAAPLFNSFSTYSPGGTPVSFTGMPGAYFEDLDFDGIKDLVATPSLFANNSNTIPNNIDFQHSSWFYKNSGSNSVPAYSFVKKNFLQNSMIELGENASPAFADFDADGDQDMFIANKGLLSGSSFLGTISLYENTGDNVQPEFNLINGDYLNLSSKGYTNIRLAFTDLNGDNAIDIAFTSYYTTSTSSTYTIKYILNTNAAGQPFAFSLTNILVLPLTASNEDIPCFYDVDKDGLQDVLLGRTSGKISYFRNIGSAAAPSYNLAKDTLGGIKVDSMLTRTYISVTVTDLSNDGLPDLITGDNSGQLRVYSDFQSNLSGIYSGFDINPDSSGLPYSLGKLLYLTSTDLNNDNYPELFIGNNAGGLICLNKPGVVLNPSGYSPVSGLTGPKHKDNIHLMIVPNPAESEITIAVSEDCKFTVIDMIGNTVRAEDWVRKDMQKNIDVENLKEGIYLIRFESGAGKSEVRKLVILK
jgi:hypothetical protein